MLAVHHLLERHFLSGMSCHAAHRCHDTGHAAAFDFVVLFVVADGGNQMLPFVLVRIVLFRLRKLPCEVGIRLRCARCRFGLVMASETPMKSRPVLSCHARNWRIPDNSPELCDR